MACARRVVGSAASWVVAALAALDLSGCGRLAPDVIRGPRKIVAGGAGACALWDDAPMRCWGYTPYNPERNNRWSGMTYAFARPSSIPDAREVLLVGASCSVDRDGRLACTTMAAARWPDVYPPLRSAAWMRDVRRPVAGGPRVCAIARAEGEPREEVFCSERVGVRLESAKETADGWARVDLGDAAALAMSAPTARTRSLGVTTDRLCALLRSGDVRCVDLPDGASHEVEGIREVVQLVLGEDFGCARDARGVVSCFGAGADGQLGDGDVGARESARPVPLPGPATDLAAYHHHACAIAGGAPYCWGLLRTEGELPAVVARSPERVAAFDDLAQIAVGSDFACATRSSDGTVRCWGRDAEGELGDGSYLPGASCSREGYHATSDERERPAAPTAVRTGDAGPHPTWRLPLALAAAAIVLVPLAWALRRARRALGRAPSAAEAPRVALYGHAVLAALLGSIALTRAVPGAIASWDFRWGRFDDRSLVWVASVITATLAPVLAYGIATASFLRFCGASPNDRARSAQKGAAWLAAAAGPLLLIAMLVTRDVNCRAREELVYLVRDAALDLSPLFVFRMVLSFLWVVLAIAHALFTLTSTRRSLEGRA